MRHVCKYDSQWFFSFYFDCGCYYLSDCLWMTNWLSEWVTDWICPSVFVCLFVNVFVSFSLFLSVCVLCCDVFMFVLDRIAPMCIFCVSVLFRHFIHKHTVKKKRIFFCFWLLCLAPLWLHARCQYTDVLHTLHTRAHTIRSYLHTLYQCSANRILTRLSSAFAPLITMLITVFIVRHLPTFGNSISK